MHTYWHFIYPIIPLSASAFIIPSFSLFPARFIAFLYCPYIYRFTWCYCFTPSVQRNISLYFLNNKVNFFDLYACAYIKELSDTINALFSLCLSLFSSSTRRFGYLSFVLMWMLKGTV